MHGCPASRSPAPVQTRGPPTTQSSKISPSKRAKSCFSQGKRAMMRKIGFRRERLMKKAKKVKKMALASIFDAHILYEFLVHDVAATMKTIVAEPYAA